MSREGRTIFIAAIKLQQQRTNARRPKMIREVWTVELGAAVGPFRLGASVADVLHALKVRARRFPGPRTPSGGCRGRRSPRGTDAAVSVSML
jgi:hypothetical protein